MLGMPLRPLPVEVRRPGRPRRTLALKMGGQVRRAPASPAFAHPGALPPSPLPGKVRRHSREVRGAHASPTSTWPGTPRRPPHVRRVWRPPAHVRRPRVMSVVRGGGVVPMVRGTTVMAPRVPMWAPHVGAHGPVSVVPEVARVLPAPPPMRAAGIGVRRTQAHTSR